MFTHCRDDGVGLAAPQVGVNLRLMGFNPTGKPGDTEYVLINPKIVSSNKKLEVVEEGCLSFPKIFADVEVRCFTNSRLGTMTYSKASRLKLRVRWRLHSKFIK